MPPVWGQSAFYSRSYALFTEEWSVCLARRSCQGDERLSIDGVPMPSVDGDARIWSEHILWPTEIQKQPQITRIPLDDVKPFMCFLNHCWRLRFIFIYSFRLGENGGTPSESSWNSFRVLLELLQSPLGTPLVLVLFIFYVIHLFIYDFCDKHHAWVDPPGRFRNF